MCHAASNAHLWGPHGSTHILPSKPTMMGSPFAPALSLHGCQRNKRRFVRAGPPVLEKQCRQSGTATAAKTCKYSTLGVKNKHCASTHHTYTLPWNLKAICKLVPVIEPDPQSHILSFKVNPAVVVGVVPTAVALSRGQTPPNGPLHGISTTYAKRSSRVRALMTDGAESAECWQMCWSVLCVHACLFDGPS